MAQDTSAKQSPPTPAVVTSLLGGVGILGALLTALGTANGGVDRIERTAPWFLLIGVICVITALAIGAAFTVFYTRTTTDKVEQLLSKPVALVVGVLLLTVGLCLVTFAAIDHISGKPGITARVSEDAQLGAVVSGDVTISDIRPTSRLEVRVDALTLRHRNGARELVPDVIYATSLGPNSSGDIDQQYQAVLPANSYQVLVVAWTSPHPPDCYSEAATPTTRALGINEQSCLRIKIPPNPIRVTAFFWFNRSWATSDRAAFEKAAHKHGADLQTLYRTHPTVRQLFGVAF